MKGRKFIDSTAPIMQDFMPRKFPTQTCRRTDNVTKQLPKQDIKVAQVGRSCTLFGVPQQKQRLVRSQRQNIVAFSPLTRFYHTTLPGEKECLRCSVQMLIDVVSFPDHCGHAQHAAKPFVTLFLLKNFDL